MRFNPPNLWITINPDNLNNPIAQIFANEEIDLDEFVCTAGPDRQTHVKNLAKNGYTGVKYFHFVIETVLKELFGISVKGSRIYRRKGIFGLVNAYFGVVEAQG